MISTQMAIEMFPEEQQKKIQISDAPLVEGALIAAVEASIGRSLNEVCIAADCTRQAKKM